jgi:hypothetical protein
LGNWLHKNGNRAPKLCHEFELYGHHRIASQSRNQPGLIFPSKSAPDPLDLQSAVEIDGPSTAQVERACRKAVA